MLSQNLQSLLENRLHYLPEISGQAIASIDWSTKLIDIGRHYGLHMDEMEDLQTVVLKLLIGLSSADHFENDLVTTLALSPTNATNMMADINEHVFAPIHEFVMNKGKKPDPMTASGIVLQPAGDTLEIPPSPATIRESTVPVPPTPKVTATPMPMVPAFQKSASAKPMVQGKFDDFFVNVPTTTDQSLGK